MAIFSLNSWAFWLSSCSVKHYELCNQWHKLGRRQRCSLQNHFAHWKPSGNSVTFSWQHRGHSSTPLVLTGCKDVQGIISGWYIYVFMSLCNPPQLFSHRRTDGFVPVSPHLLHPQPNLLDPDLQSPPNRRPTWLSSKRRGKMWKPFPKSSPSMKILTFVVNCQRGRSSAQIFSRHQRGKQVPWRHQCGLATDCDLIAFNNAHLKLMLQLCNVRQRGVFATTACVAAFTILRRCLWLEVSNRLDLVFWGHLTSCPQCVTCRLFSRSF